MGKYYDAYLSFSQTPNEYYRGLNQETINSTWTNTTQLRTIKEQAYPFSNTYIEYEAWIDTVSDISVNTTKVIGDYIGIMFKDIDHALNHRGQKYLYKPDGISENVYLCYDKLNPLTQVPDFKAIRCNNHLTMLGSNGEIIKEPCSIGYEITATNNNTTKDATVAQRRMVLIVQGNENTSNIKLNQRFIFQHKQAYKVTEFNVLNQEDYNDEVATMYTFYIEWSGILPSDNLELNLADYYTTVYSLNINSTDLSLVNGSTGQLTSTVTLNGTTQSGTPLKWSTSNSDVVKIDQLGNYQVVGLSGSTAVITCCIDGNDTVSDTINLNVVSSTTSIKEIKISPNTNTRLTQGAHLDIYYGVYLNNEMTADFVGVGVNYTDTNYYIMEYLDGFVRITNILKNSQPLELIFISSGLDSKSITITLGGII